MANSASSVSNSSDLLLSSEFSFGFAPDAVDSSVRQHRRRSRGRVSSRLSSSPLTHLVTPIWQQLWEPQRWHRARRPDAPEMPPGVTLLVMRVRQIARRDFPGDSPAPWASWVFRSGTRNSRACRAEDRNAEKLF